jgi:protein kinase A
MKKISNLLGGKKKSKESTSADSPTSPTVKSPFSSTFHPASTTFKAPATPSQSIDNSATPSPGTALPSTSNPSDSTTAMGGLNAQAPSAMAASNAHSSSGPSVRSLLNAPPATIDPSPNTSLQNVDSAALAHQAMASVMVPRETKGKYQLFDFNIQRTLGTGSFGRVHLVQSKHNERFYAVKVLKKAQIVKMKQVEHTNDERRMLQRVKHPFVITLWGTFQDAKNLYMVMDFIEGGELFSLLRRSQVNLSYLVCVALTA